MIDDRKKSVKILVVEDDEASSTIIVRFLNQMGFTKMVLAENEKSRVAEALQSGVSDYVLKPVDYKILVGKVEKLLNL